MYEAIRGRIAEIIGEASMLWTVTPTGIFKTEKAKELVDEIMAHIQHPLEHPEGEKNTCPECGVVWEYIHDCKLKKLKSSQKATRDKY